MLENASVASAKDAEDAEAPSSLSPELINQDKYVGIERSHWVPRESMPLRGFAITNSGKTSPRSYKPASEVIALERKEFPARTIFPEKFPVPVVCSGFCDKLSRCKVLHTEFEDLCKHHNRTGKLVTPVDIKWSVRFNMKMDFEVKAKTPFVKSTISVNVPEIALAHERTEDKTFAAYSAQQFLDTFDEPEEGHELEYTMDTGMTSPDKSQAGEVPSFMYRTIYRDGRILIGFETRRVQKVHMSSDRVWFLQNGKPIYADIETPEVTEYLESIPVYKWIRLPTLRPIGCNLKPMKVVGSTTIMIHKERKFYKDRREVECQNRRHDRVLIRQDEIDSRKQVVSATC